MTLIVGIEDQGAVYMAADSGAWGSDGFEDVGAHSKIARVGLLLIGVSGDLRASNLIRHCIDGVQEVDASDVEGWLVREFVPRLRETVLDHGADKPLSDNSKGWGGWCMVGVKGNVYLLSGAYCVFRSARGYAVAGADSACGVALGVLHATPHLPPAERLRMAAEAAVECTDAVRGPFTYETLEAT